MGVSSTRAASYYSRLEGEENSMMRDRLQSRCVSEIRLADRLTYCTPVASRSLPTARSDPMLTSIMVCSGVRFVRSREQSSIRFSRRSTKSWEVLGLTTQRRLGIIVAYEICVG